MMKRFSILLTIICAIFANLAFGQGSYRGGDYIYYKQLSIGKKGMLYTHPSAWLEIGKDTTEKVMILPRFNDTSSIDTPWTFGDFGIDWTDSSAKVYTDSWEKVLTDKNFVLPDFSTTYWAQNGNAFGANGVLGTTDVYPIHIMSNNNVGIRVHTNGNVSVDSSYNNTSYKFQVTGEYSGGAIYAYVPYNSSNFVPIIEGRSLFHNVSYFQLGTRQYHTEIQTHELDIHTLGTSVRESTIKFGGGAPAAGGITIDKVTMATHAIDLKGGTLGTGWRLYIPEGLWNYRHTSFKYQLLNTQLGSSTDPDFQFNSYSKTNIIRGFGTTGNVAIGSGTDNSSRLRIVNNTTSNHTIHVRNDASTAATYIPLIKSESGYFSGRSEFEFGTYSNITRMTTWELELWTQGASGRAKSIFVAGGAPAAGAIIVNGNSSGYGEIDLGGGIFGNGWKLFASEGIWAYDHSSSKFQAINFQAGAFSTQPDVQFNTRSYSNLIRLWGNTGNISIGNKATDPGVAIHLEGTTTINGITKILNKLNITAADYADNAAAIAGGLSVGDVYQTSGALKVVY